MVLSASNVGGQQSGGRSIPTRSSYGKVRTGSLPLSWPFLAQVVLPLLCSPAHMTNCKAGPLRGEGIPQTGPVMHHITASCTTVQEIEISYKTASDKDVITPPFGRAHYPSYHINHHANKTPPYFKSVNSYSYSDHPSPVKFVASRAMQCSKMLHLLEGLNPCAMRKTSKQYQMFHDTPNTPSYNHDLVFFLYLLLDFLSWYTVFPFTVADQYPA